MNRPAITTTAFTPNPTCFEPSNTFQYYYPCTQDLSNNPPVTITQSEFRCGINVLGPYSDAECHQRLQETGGWSSLAWSDCPVGMTAADEWSSVTKEGVTLYTTQCCPTAYDFKYIPFWYDGNSNAPAPTPFPSNWYEDELEFNMNSGAFCKATSVEGMDEREFILATPAAVSKIVYELHETTSTCIGDYGNNVWMCNPFSNDLWPTPSPTLPPDAPTSSYVTPTTPPLTHFEPAASCIPEKAGDDLWEVSVSCVLENNANYPPPDWENRKCALTKVGQPNADNGDCYGKYGEDPPAGTFYSACPVGYTPAMTATWMPFDTTLYPDTTSTLRYDVTSTGIGCCPSISGLDFFYPTEVFNPGERGTISYGDAIWTVFTYPVPGCMATSVKALDGKTVTMGVYSDSRVWDRKRQEGEKTSVKWDVKKGTIFAEAMGYGYTVFHGTHTCYTDCDRYFTFSYHNTDPNYTPPPKTTSTSSTNGGGSRVVDNSIQFNSKVKLN